MRRSRKKQGSSSNNRHVRAVPLGGLGEIGKNMMFLEYIDENTHDSIIIDAGIMFPESDMLGIDYIIPDFTSVQDRFHTVRGVVITHGHEDHIGAVGHLMQHISAPLYATPLTMALIEPKLRNAHVLNNVKRRNIRAGETLQLGAFNVECFHMCHSIPDSLGLAIETPIGIFVHTGDFKIDHTPVDGRPPDFAKMAELAQRGVLCLFSDSTNINVPGWTPSEVLIDEAFNKHFAEAPGRIMVATFASLISRIQQVANATERFGRKMAVTGTSMVENTRIATELGYLKLPQGLLVDINQANKMPKNKIVIMTTGTQGEPRAGLGLLSKGEHPSLSVEHDDTVIMSSHPIPGNEEGVYRTMNKLLQKGATVIYDSLASVHVSGHAAHEELKFVFNLLRPKFFVPVHGELRHLYAHAEMAVRMGTPRENIAVVENGYQLIFTEHSMTVGDRLPGGYMFVDGARVGDIGPEVLRDREILGHNGFVIVNVTLDRDTRQIIGQPEFISRGFVFLRDAKPMMNEAQGVITGIISANGHGSVRNLRGDIEKRLDRFFYSQTGRRPMVFAFVKEV